MTATNHALTGAIIGLTITNPTIAVVAAFFSHYVCDAIPHYDDADDHRMEKRSFRFYLGIDAFVCVLLVSLLAITQPRDWLIAAVCAFLATSPDLFWINRYLHVLRKKPWKPGLHSRFASRIQWFERPIGAVVEIAWFITLSIVVGTVIAYA